MILNSFLGFLADSSFWMKALQLIASLGLLVFIHELGHFMWARWFGVRVEKFYLFFDIGFKKLWDGSLVKYKPKNSTPSTVSVGCRWAAIVRSRA